MTAKFLSWDPSAPTKLAWVRSGTTTALVATEQLRSAVGFEQWVPTEQDVTALKDASKALSESLWTDESGPPPAEEEMLEAQPLHRVLGDEDFLMDYQSNSELLAATSSQQARQQRLDAAASWAPGTPIPMPEPPQAQLSGTINNTYVYARLGDVGQGARRGNSVPRKLRRSRSPAPLTTMSTPRPALPPGLPELPQPQEGHVPAVPDPEPPADLLSPEFSAPFEELPGLPELPQPQGGQLAAQPPGPTADLARDAAPAPLDDLPDDVRDYVPSPVPDLPETPAPSATLLPLTPADSGQPAPPSASTSSRPPTTPVTSSAASGVTAPSLLPAKRTFDSLAATLYEEDGLLHRLPLGQNLGEFYGPPCDQFYEAYLASKYRSDDVLGSDKPAQEADSSDSDWEDAPPKSSSRQGMSRMEAKALDREIPWRKIMDLPSAQFQAYKEAVEKEHSSWMEWRSVRALTHQEASEVLKDKVLAKRVLRTRSCFRDKAKGLGPLRAKCRVVALGHNDPDLRRLNRECPTPNRTSEHVLFLVLVAGSNREFGNSSKKWFGWTDDAATAFLQGEQPSDERTLPL